MVISNAAYNNPNVKGLVYIAALAPKEGQSISSFTDPAKFPKGSLIIDKGGFAYFSPNLFHNSFPDIDPTQAKILSIIHSVGMNRIHIISGTVIATISLRVTAATMPDQQPALAHEGYYYYGYHNNHHHGGSGAAGGAGWR